MTKSTEGKRTECSNVMICSKKLLNAIFAYFYELIHIDSVIPIQYWFALHLIKCQKGNQFFTYIT